MVQKSILKAALYFTGSKTTRPELSVVRVRSEEDSPTIITEATNGHIAIQITSNDSEYELDSFSLIMPVESIKEYLKTGKEVDFLEDVGDFPDIDTAVEEARTQDELHPTRLQLQYLTATSMALRALFTAGREEWVDISSDENIQLPIMLSANGTSKDGDEVVVDIFIMGMRK